MQIDLALVRSIVYARPAERNPMTMISLHTDMSFAAAQAVPGRGTSVVDGYRFGDMVALAGRRAR